MFEEPLHRRFDALDEVAEPANELRLRSLLAVADGAGDLSVTWVRIEGRHQRLRTDASSRLYLALEGQGTITVRETDYPVGPGDLVVVPPGSPYHLEGQLTYLVINQPGFRAGDDLYLDADDEVRGTEPETRPAASDEES